MQIPLAISPAALAAATALLTQNVLYTLAAAAAGSLLALAEIGARMRADQPRRQRHRIENQALMRIAQTEPERMLEISARLPPMASPFAREPSPAEGPAPPEPVTPPGDPAAGGAAGAR
ncbi:hypothetical protein [Streptomyces sp. RKAG293]|uniref:hypothetical protein n=1 Tax=Streptomyces sp. RKAG293 TaxID=2893403 RepID=UPI0020332F57|nr:hypothetical protein [Streptomyces sp. RKAG293]MCM2424253.1 hypothetical protein [Streptomyces sp. RKAG293]